jgi:hypothetical protein
MQQNITKFKLVHFLAAPRVWAETIQKTAVAQKRSATVYRALRSFGWECFRVCNCGFVL